MDSADRKAFEAFLDEHSVAVADESRRLHAAISASFPDVTHRWIAGWQLVGYYLPKGRRIALLNPVDDQVVVYFENGASLPDPHGLLGGQQDMAKLRKIFVDPPASDELMEQILDYLDLQYEFSAGL